MAKPIQATPALSGADAAVIIEELTRGPRQNPAREAMLAKSEQVHPKHLQAMMRDIASHPNWIKNAKATHD